jgi:NADP-dependent 3-hydroxy acid dehydrogenase YdfG
MREIRGANRATMSIQDADAATNPRVWLITGASSGFGRAIATAALDGGDIVVATARRPQALDDLIAAYPTRAQAIALDVTNMNATQVIDGVIARHGRIDVLVNTPVVPRSGPWRRPPSRSCAICSNCTSSGRRR